MAGDDKTGGLRPLGSYLWTTAKEALGTVYEGGSKVAGIAYEEGSKVAGVAYQGGSKVVGLAYEGGGKVFGEIGETYQAVLYGWSPQAAHNASLRSSDKASHQLLDEITTAENAKTVEPTPEISKDGPAKE